MTMPDVTWMIKGREFIHYNCDYGCPRQFNAQSAHGHRVAGVEIAEG
jgi:hypothetical protein